MWLTTLVQTPGHFLPTRQTCPGKVRPSLSSAHKSQPLKTKPYDVSRLTMDDHTLLAPNRHDTLSLSQSELLHHINDLETPRVRHVVVVDTVIRRQGVWSGQCARETGVELERWLVSRRREGEGSQNASSSLMLRGVRILPICGIGREGKTHKRFSSRDVVQ